MNCFNHRDRPAIGLCKACGKGLCGDCLTELPNGLACKGSCEKRADLLNCITESDAETKIAARHRLFDVGVWNFFLGINFVFAIGAYIVAAYLEKDYPLIAFRVFSIVLVVCSAVWILVGITQLLTGIFRLRRRTRNPQIKEKTA
jgi:hypothetical protein